MSERTIEWYEESFHWLARYELTPEGIKNFVIGMREAGLKPTSCNSRIRVANAYFRWSGLPLHLAKLKEEHEILPSFNQEGLRRLIQYRPKTWSEKRLSTLICLLIDCGVRINEALELRRADIDFEDLLLVVRGKGNKQRRLPFSLELRKPLLAWTKQHTFELVFPTRDGTKQGRRDVLRDVKRLCRCLGFEPPRRTLHAFRHTMAVEYIRSGGGEFRLQKMLGHSSLSQTRKYIELCSQDLKDIMSGYRF